VHGIRKCLLVTQFAALLHRQTPVHHDNLRPGNAVPVLLLFTKQFHVGEVRRALYNFQETGLHLTQVSRVRKRCIVGDQSDR
jgi:hypothetical protein